MMSYVAGSIVLNRKLECFIPSGLELEAEKEPVRGARLARGFNIINVDTQVHRRARGSLTK